VKAAAHAVHYGMGVPVRPRGRPRGRPVPVIVREFTGVRITQSALTQDALKKAEGVIGNACQELRAGVATAPAVYTDDTGWRIHGEGAQLMTFDTDRATVFQIRRQHRNEPKNGSWRAAKHINSCSRKYLHRKQFSPDG